MEEELIETKFFKDGVLVTKMVPISKMTYGIACFNLDTHPDGTEFTAYSPQNKAELDSFLAKDEFICPKCGTSAEPFTMYNP